MSKSWGTDDELLAELKEALATAGHLGQGIAAGYAAWSWRAVNEELDIALLKYDSYLDAPVGVRGVQLPEARLLIFQGANEEASLEVEVAGDQLVGQITPPLTAKIVLLVQGGIQSETSTDDLGCFSLHVPDGVFRLQCVTPHTALITEWVRL
jgi:hypothetical protein